MTLARCKDALFSYHCFAGGALAKVLSLIIAAVTKPLSTMQTVIEQERGRFDQQRRRTYQIAGSLGVLMVAIDIVKQSLDHTQPLVVRLVYIVNDLFLIAISLFVVWLVTTRRGKLTTVERLMFIVFAAESLLFNGIVPPLLGQTLALRWEQTVNDDIWFLLMICTLGFHLFRHRASVLIVTSLYGLSVIILGGQILFSMPHEPLEPGLRSLQVYGMGAIFLCFIYIVSRYRAQTQRLQIEYELMEEWAFVDMLTGLANRRRCEQVLQEAIARYQRYGEPFTICLWDIDHFKQINDTYGHEGGDQILRQMARLARTTIRSTDFVGRWGGEEFFLLLPCTHLAEAEQLTDRLRHQIMGRIGLSDRVVTASFGLAEHHPSDDQTSLLARADSALYEAKSTGRNRVVGAELSPSFV